MADLGQIPVGGASYTSETKLSEVKFSSVIKHILIFAKKGIENELLLYVTTFFIFKYLCYSTPPSTYDGCTCTFTLDLDLMALYLPIQHT